MQFIHICWFYKVHFRENPFILYAWNTCSYLDSKEKSSLIKELFSSLRIILTESLIDYMFKEVGKGIFVNIS